MGSTVGTSDRDGGDQLISGLLDNLPDQLIRFGLDGKISYVNDVFCRFWNIERGDALGEGFANCYPEKDGSDLIRQCLDLSKEKPTFEDVRRFTKPDGTACWLRHVFTAVAGRDGEIAAYQTVVHDVSTMMIRQSELEETVSRTNAATVAKSEFLANTSHEIRTAMNAVVGLISLLTRSDLDDEQRRFVDNLVASSEHLILIINDILDLSKIEAGKLEIEEERFDLRDLVTEIKTLFEERALNKKLALKTLQKSALPRVVVSDRMRIKQVLVNLLSNAIKFTEIGEISLTVSARRLGSERLILRFSVRDSGIGIPDHYMEKLYEPFTQADSSLSRQYGGTGLGLAISKRIADTLGGSLSAHNRAVGGCVFNFSVPV